MKYFKICDLFGAGADYHLSVFFARLIKYSNENLILDQYFDARPVEFGNIVFFHSCCYFSSMGVGFSVDYDTIKCVSDTLISIYENVILSDDYSFDNFDFDIIDNADAFAQVVQSLRKGV